MTNDKPIHEIVDEEMACDHPATKIRYKIDSLGRRLYVKQCLGCGSQIGSAIKHSEVSSPKATQLFDEKLRRTWWKRRQERNQELWAERKERFESERTEQRGDWFAEHNEYLKSPEWKRRRAAVLARDDYKCRAGYVGCKGRATIAHHLNYSHWRNEPLFDLISVCRHCHDILHPENSNGRK